MEYQEFEIDYPLEDQELQSAGGNIYIEEQIPRKIRNLIIGSRKYYQSKMGWNRKKLNLWETWSKN